MSELQLAVWGAGAMGERVVRSAASVPGVRVSAVIDVDGARAGRVADAVGAAAAVDLDEACRRTPVQAVYIGLPNAAHRDACLAAARHGLHVLVDKPLTTTVADADVVVAAAADAGGFWMTGFSYRFRAEWRRAAQLIADGAIGRPYFVSDEVIEAYRRTPEWYWDIGRGGGTLRLQSHHVFDRWEWMLGAEVTAVSAQVLHPVPGTADRSVTIAARLGDGLIGSSALSFGVGYDAPPRVALTVQGTHGMVRIDESRLLSVATADGLHEERHSDDDWLARELEAFAAGARGEGAGQPSLADGRRATVLAEAAACSAVDGSWVATARSIEGGR